MNLNIKSSIDNLVSIAGGKVTSGCNYVAPSSIAMTLDKQSLDIVREYRDSDAHAYRMIFCGTELGMIFVPTEKLIQLYNRHPVFNEDPNSVESVERGNVVCKYVLNFAFDQLLGGNASLHHPDPDFPLMKEVESMARFLSKVIGRDSYTYDMGPMDPKENGRLGALRLKISLLANADNHVIWCARQPSSPYFVTTVGMPVVTVRQVLHSFTELYDKALFGDKVPTAVLEREVIQEYLRIQLSIRNDDFAERMEDELLVGLKMELMCPDRGMGFELLNLFFDDRGGKKMIALIRVAGVSKEVEVLSAREFTRAMAPENKIPAAEIPTEPATFKLPDYKKIAEKVYEAIIQVVPVPKMPT